MSPPCSLISLLNTVMSLHGAGLASVPQILAHAVDQRDGAQQSMKGYISTTSTAENVKKVWTSDPGGFHTFHSLSGLQASASSNLYGLHTALESQGSRQVLFSQSHQSKLTLEASMNYSRIAHKATQSKKIGIVA